MAYILDLFCNVERLTFVVEHYENEKYEGSMKYNERMAQLEFLSSIDIEQSVKIFEHPEVYTGLDTETLPEGAWALEIGGRVDPEVLEKKKLDPKRGHKAWKTPVIEYKTLSTTTMKLAFEELKTDFQQRSGCHCRRTHKGRESDDDLW